MIGCDLPFILRAPPLHPTCTSGVGFLSPVSLTPLVSLPPILFCLLALASLLFSLLLSLYLSLPFFSALILCHLFSRLLSSPYYPAFPFSPAPYLIPFYSTDGGLSVSQ